MSTNLTLKQLKARLLKEIGVGLLCLFIALCAMGYHDARGGEAGSILTSAFESGRAVTGERKNRLDAIRRERKIAFSVCLISSLVGIGFLIVSPVRYWLNKDK